MCVRGRKRGRVSEREKERERERKGIGLILKDRKNGKRKEWGL